MPLTICNPWMSSSFKSLFLLAKTVSGPSLPLLFLLISLQETPRPFLLFIGGKILSFFRDRPPGDMSVWVCCVCLCARRLVFPVHCFLDVKVAPKTTKLPGFSTSPLVPCSDSNSPSKEYAILLVKVVSPKKETYWWPCCSYWLDSKVGSREWCWGYLFEKRQKDTDSCNQNL